MAQLLGPSAAFPALAVGTAFTAEPAAVLFSEYGPGSRLHQTVRLRNATGTSLRLRRAGRPAALPNTIAPHSGEARGLYAHNLLWTQLNTCAHAKKPLRLT